MRNLADIIENFIIRQLLADSDNTIMVQRNELADRLSCAPSQISYVLSTRFTPEKGFLVESRRGSGGFVRIVRVVPQIDEQIIKPTVEEMLDYWVNNRLITGRERALLLYMTSILNADEDEKIAILQNAVAKLIECK